MPLAFPYGIDRTGRTATPANEAEHARGLIEQVLLTSAGERVNRPSLGTGVYQLLFSPAGPELATATQQLVKSALGQWLAAWLEVSDVSVVSEDSTLVITVRYRLRRSGEERTDTFRANPPEVP